MGGEALPDLSPDARQGWVEKWLYLAAEEREQAAEEPSESGANLAMDDLARRLGAREVR